MNNKGFTLVELLAVIVILSSLSIVAVVSVTSSLGRRDEKECQEQISLAKNAAKIYFSLNNVTSVTVSTLKNANYFEEETKTDKLDLNAVITIDTANGKYKYTGSGECQES